MNNSQDKSIIKEIASKKEEKTKHHKENFQALIMKKKARVISKMGLF